MKLLMQVKNKFSAVSRDLIVHSGRFSMHVEGALEAPSFPERGESWVNLSY